MKLEDIDQASKLKREREAKLAHIRALWAAVDEDERRLRDLGVQLDQPTLQAAE